MATSLALKYRPQKWDDLVEQDAVKITLAQQIKENNIAHALLFCGSAGCGKTTAARIFANEVNHGYGIPEELDAASHNSVDDIRAIIERAQTKSLEGEYRIIILDESHMLSISAQNALLKILEEPPEKVIFILCTTNPEKLAPTILSRVQRYDFKKISFNGILNRLKFVLDNEDITTWDTDALSYIAKMSNGGMRTSLTLLDRCISYSSDLTVDNVIKALGITGYADMNNLTVCLVKYDFNHVIGVLNDICNSGVDIKSWIKQYTNFVLDVIKYQITSNFDYIQIPNTFADKLNNFKSVDLYWLLDCLVKLNNDLKYDTTPKETVEASLILSAIHQKESES